MRDTELSAIPASIPEDAAPDAPPSYAHTAVNFALMGATPFEMDKDGHMHWPNAGDAARLLRCRPETLPQSRDGFDSRLEASARRQRSTALRSLTWDGARYHISYQIDGMDGRRVWVEERGQRLMGEGATPHAITAVLIDIQGRKAEEQAAIYNASFDPQTDMWNARRLSEAIGFLHQGLRYFRRSGAVLRVRIANLPDINASYGYDTGDHLLSAVAARLKARYNAPDMVGRVGGISFAIALADCAPDEMAVRANKLLTALSDTPYPSPHGNLYAEFTVAAVPLDPSDRPDMDALMRRSRATLQKSTAQSLRYLAYDPAAIAAPEPTARRVLQPDDIITALNDRRISLAYQPIIHAQTRDLHHYECLLRLKRDDGEIVSAGGFIMAAEKLGLVNLLDRRALEIAADTLQRYPEIKLALNVSAATVKDMDTANAYLEALRALGPATSRVTLELTETVALEDPAMASRFSVEARMMGCEFSIDDFGSGYTTFQNLMAIEADSVKIDGSFIRDLSMTPHKQTFVRMMVDLAQTFGVTTVAEMVETREDADLLKRLGVDYLQGFMFGVPSAAPAWQRHDG